MTITYHRDLIQGSDEWLAARMGIITASRVGAILTPTLKVAANDKTRAHAYELLAQRITGHVEPQFIGDDMLRGMGEEIYARREYAANYAAVEQVGFVTNDAWGFKIGYSPDGLVGKEGLIEVKSRNHKYQVKTVIENVLTGTIPAEFMLQCQAGLLVTERLWLDFISYSGGLPMAVVRVYPYDKIHDAIVTACGEFEDHLRLLRGQYDAAIDAMFPLIETKIQDAAGEITL